LKDIIITVLIYFSIRVNRMLLT